MKKIFCVAALLILVLPLAAYAIEGYAWGMKREEATQTASEMARMIGLEAKLQGVTNDAVYLKTTSGKTIVGTTILRFDEKGALNGVGTTIRLPNDPGKARAFFNAASKDLLKTGYKLINHSADKNEYESDADKVLLLLKEEAAGYTLGLIIKRKE